MSDNNIKYKDRKSLCEESMLVFVNILKLSSLSLARTMVPSTSHHDHNYHDHDHHDDQFSSNHTKNTTIYNNHKAIVHHGTNTPSLLPVAEPQRMRKRSQKSKPKPESKLSYVKLHNNNNNNNNNNNHHHDETTSTIDGIFADYIRRFHEKADNDLQNAIVEGKAANYIKRFHEKNMKDLNNESVRRANYVLPPPPHRQVFE